MCRRILAVTLLVTVPSAPAYANFIDDWYLAIVFSPGNATIETVSFDQPVAPFVDSHTIDWLGSIGTARYDFEWDEAGGTFDIACDTELAAFPGVNRSMMTAGFIYLNSPVPLLISGTSEFDYNLPRDPMYAIVDLGIGTEDGSEVVVVDVDLYSTITGAPHAGTLTAEFSDVLLPANETFVMEYSFLIDTDRDVSGSALATGMGTAHFDVTAIPEPTSMCLLGIPAVVFAAHRFRRSG